MDELGSSEDSTSGGINPASLPQVVRDLWESMLRVDPNWSFEEWLIARAEEESELLVSKLNEEALRLEHRRHRVGRLIERIERQMSEPKRIADPHQKNLFDAYKEPVKITIENQKEEMPIVETIDDIEDGIDDPILHICCEHILQEMEEASDGAAHEDDLLEICASVGFDEVEVREAIEHLVVANQITHLGEGLYGFAD
jgi:DNA-binding transcriptional regulator PaaX